MEGKNESRVGCFENGKFYSPEQNDMYKYEIFLHQLTHINGSINVRSWPLGARKAKTEVPFS